MRRADHWTVAIREQLGHRTVRGARILRASKPRRVTSAGTEWAVSCNGSGTSKQPRIATRWFSSGRSATASLAPHGYPDSGGVGGDHGWEVGHGDAGHVVGVGVDPP